jgi:alcohol dehydrogenase
MASSLNPADYKSAEGGQAALITFAWPRVYGFDFSGYVHSVPTNSKYNVGDKVFGMIAGLPQLHNGTLAQYCVVDEDVCARSPDNVAFTDLAALPLVGITTVLAFEACDVCNKPNPRVLVTGGAGGVGTIALQIAKHVYNASSLTTTASAGVKTDLCKSLGADVVVDYRAGRFEDALSAKNGGEPFDIIFDTTGEAARCVSLLAEGGSLCSILAGPTVAAIRSWLARSRIPHSNITTGVRPFLMSGVGGGIFNCVGGGRSMTGKCSKKKATFHHVIGTGDGRIMELISTWVKEGKVKSVIDSTFDLGRAAEAVERLKGGRCMG